MVLNLIMEIEGIYDKGICKVVEIIKRNLYGFRNNKLNLYGFKTL